MLRRFARLGVLVVLGSMLGGCIILPLHGWGHGYEHEHSHEDFGYRH